ncbi:MAG: flagellar export protein FliJ [Magnetococcales bacterium]|nr:flagellar export protein FliJ [Magnetococcales bacterium]
MRGHRQRGDRVEMGGTINGHSLPTPPDIMACLGPFGESCLRVHLLRGNGSSIMAVNRFSRLVELRQIQEETEAMAYSRNLAWMEGLRLKLQQIDLETEQAREEVRHLQTTDSSRLSPSVYENFFRGQVVRRRRLQVSIQQAREEVRKSREAWHAVRVQLKKTEKLQEKESDKLNALASHKEMKELDMIGLLQLKDAS